MVLRESCRNESIKNHDFWHNIEDKFISYTQVEKIEPDQNLDVVPL